MKVFNEYVPEELYVKFKRELTEWHNDEKNKEGWICISCGKSTYETDFDYLIAPNLHLVCSIEKELDK